MKSLSIFLLIITLFGGVPFDSIAAMNCSFEFPGDNAFPLLDGKIACTFARDGFIRIYDSKSGAMIREIFGFGTRNCEVFQLKDQSIVAVCRDHGVIRRWDWETGDLLASMNCFDEYKKISAFYTFDNETIAVAAPNTPVKIIDIKNACVIQEFKKCCGVVTSMAEMPHDNFVVGTECGDIFLFDRKTGDSSISMYSDSGPIKDLFFMENGAYLYAISSLVIEDSGIKLDLGIIQRWSPLRASPEYGCVVELSEKINTYFFTALLKNGFFITTSGRNKIKVWNLELGKYLKYLSDDESGRITALTALSEACFAIGSACGKIQLWNGETGECVASFVGHKNAVEKLFLLGKNKLVSVADDEKIKIWNVND